MRRAIIKLGLALVMITLVVIAGCAPKAAPTPKAQKTPVAPTPKAAPEKVYKIRFNAVSSPISPTWKAQYIGMKNDLEKMSGGRLVIDYYTSQALINMREAFEGVSRGIADITFTWTCWYPDTFPLDDLFSYPYKTGMRQTNAIFQKLRKDFTDEQWVRNWPDAVHLATYICRPGYLFTRSKPVYKYEDIKGLTVFTITAPDSDLYKNLGASVIAGWSGAESYELMSKGATDAAFGSASMAAFSYKFHELGKPGYIIDMGGTGCGTNNFAANRPWWNTLPQDLQKLILDRVQYYGDASGDHGDFLQYYATITQELKAYAWLAKNATTVVIDWSDAEKARFRKDHVDGLWDVWEARANAKGFPATEYRAAFEKLIPEMNEKFSPLKEIPDPLEGGKVTNHVEQLGAPLWW